MPERTVLAVGELAILTCEVSGDPEPSVTWSKDGDTNIPRAQIKNDGRILAFKHVLPLDSGVYECKASNRFGESRTSTIVIVAGKLYWLQYGLISSEIQVTDENLGKVLSILEAKTLFLLGLTFVFYVLNKVIITIYLVFLFTLKVAYIYFLILAL